MPPHRATPRIKRRTGERGPGHADRFRQPAVQRTRPRGRTCKHRARDIKVYGLGDGMGAGVSATGGSDGAAGVGNGMEGTVEGGLDSGEVRFGLPAVERGAVILELEREAMSAGRGKRCGA